MPIAHDGTSLLRVRAHVCTEGTGLPRGRILEAYKQLDLGMIA